MKPYTRSQLIAFMRQRRLLPERQIEIECDNVAAIHYCDLLELYLYLSRLSAWQWVDKDGNCVQRQSLFAVVYALLTDGLAWGWLYGKHTKQINDLSSRLKPALLDQQRQSALFLRTDHWFHVQSGGSVGHLRGVIDGLRQVGYHTQVVSTDYLVGVAPHQDFACCAPVYKIGRNLPEMNELRYNEELLSFVRRQWQQWQPAFIYQRYSLGNYTGVHLKDLFGVPYVCEYNGSFAWMTQNWAGKRLFHEGLINKIELLNLHAADLVVVVSKPMFHELIARGIAAEKILVNPNGVDPEQYSPAIDGASIRQRYQFADKIVVGFIGTFGPWHGAEVLADAFGQLLHQFPDLRERLRLLLIGDGVTMSQVKENLKKWQVQDYTVLTGSIPQQQGPVHLAACDILASPHVPNPDGTPFFGSPTKLFEYMAMGKGIVASDLEQIGEILQHDHSAWLVKPGDTVSLALGIKQLVDDTHLRQRLGKVARQEVVEKFTWRAHTEKIIQALHEQSGT